MMRPLSIYKIGADAEFFLFTNKENRVVPAYDYISGDKKSPIWLKDTENPGVGGNMQHDNIMAEIATFPASTEDRFVANIKFLRSQMDRYLSERGVASRVLPSMRIPRELLDDERSKNVGCVPDINAYTRRKNKALRAKDLKSARTCGAHLHVSFHSDVLPNITEKCAVVKFMDICLGLPSVSLDSDSMRRRFYGKAGSFRNTKYSVDSEGLEYRTLSSFWVGNENYMRWAYKQIHKSLEWYNLVVEQPELAEDYDFDATFNRVRQIIDNNDTQAARKFISEWHIEMP